MDMTTLSRVRALRGIQATDTANDTVIEQIITSVSARASSRLRRHVEVASRIETYMGANGARVLLLRGVPVESIASLSVGDTALEADTYVLDQETGIVRFSAGVYRAVEIDYTGGMAADTADFVDRWPAIAGVIDSQVVYEFGRRAMPGGNVQTREGGATFAESGIDWLPIVRDVLDSYALGGRMSS